MTSPHTSSFPATAALDAEAEAVFDVPVIPSRLKHGWIVRRWLDLPVGQSFVLLNDHDPVPLHYQFEAEFCGTFAWDYLERGPEDFRVRITKLAPVAAPVVSLGRSAVPPSAPVVASGPTVELDTRGLGPLEPLVRILDALESLPFDARLRAHTDREPRHLFDEANLRGFRHVSTLQPDGTWITLLERE